MNPRLAHLFMICSNIKLTAPAESIGLRDSSDFVKEIKGIQRWTCNVSWKSWPMPPNTTRPAPPAAPSSGIAATARASARPRPGMGICHSYAPDGRCISLLKILLTNACNYDCLYCVNRASSNVPRARFTVDEVVKLTIDFYRRNYIEGLFLSSGIIRSADYTMEQVVSVARRLREEHHFRGYIHLKTIPEADDALIAEAGKYADRLSINIEVPEEDKPRQTGAGKRRARDPPHHGPAAAQARRSAGRPQDHARRQNRRASRRPARARR